MLMLPFIFPGYLFGSVPFGLLLTRLAGLGDIRAIGSGSIGATNVLRTGNKGLAAATLLLDAAKGAFAVGVFRYLGPPDAALWAGLGAVFGHLFPVWLGFKGGKGVATGLGVMLPICPEAVGAGVILWLIVVAFWRYSSLGSIVATAALPILVYFLYAPGHAPPGYVNSCTIFISLLVLWKHRYNMRRLIAGEETPISPRQ